MTSRTESNGKNKQELCTIGLVDEHYVYTDKTELASHCLKNYDDVKHTSEKQRRTKKQRNQNK